MSHPELRCTKCGYDGKAVTPNGQGFGYLEDVVSWRQVGEFAGDTLMIEGFYQLGEGYDEGTNGRFECRSCLDEFPIPDWLIYDFA